MVKYLFASHGEFSTGTLSFMKIMVGELENVYSLVAFLDEKSIDLLVREKLSEIGEYDQLLVFCDLYGGSVAQEVYRQTSGDKRVHIITGYNIALALDLLLKGQEVSEEDIRNSIKSATEAIVYLNDCKQSFDDELF